MPPGPVTIAADEPNVASLEALRAHLDSLGMPVTIIEDGAADLLLTAERPQRPASHMVFTGDLTDDIDAWDRDVPPQTVAGALWTPAGCDVVESATAWFCLRRRTPTTPLSDLTDANDRALRWSLVRAAHVPLPTARAADVDEEQVRAWLDEQAQVQELGAAVNRLGGDTADAVLTSADRFRMAMTGLHELAELPAAPESSQFEVALAEHLRQVQLSGLRRWRAARSRAQTQEALATAAREIAAQRLRTLIDVRTEAIAHQRASEVTERAHAEALHVLQETVLALELPAVVDFRKVPRSWPGEPAAPRRYVLLPPEEATVTIDGATIRATEDITGRHGICMVIQSGFSLPGLR